MNNKTNLNLDTLSVNENKKLMKQFEEGGR